MAGPQGGDVEGTTKIDVSQGEALAVASASFEAGYSDADGFVDGLTKADLVQGFFSYGRAVGERGKR